MRLSADRMARLCTVMAMIAATPLCDPPSLGQTPDYDIFVILPPDYVVCGDLGETLCPIDPGGCGVVPESWSVKPEAINRHAQVVGNIKIVDLGEGCFVDRAFLYLPAPAYGFTVPGVHYLRAPNDATFQVKTFAYDINDAGIVVGQVDEGDGQRGMVWDLHDADPLIGEDVLPSTTLTARAVNDADPYEVVGDLDGGVAFKWNSGTGQITPYGPVGRLTNAGALDLTTPNGASGAPVIGGWSRSYPTDKGCLLTPPHGDATAWTPTATELDQPMAFNHPSRPDEIDGEVRAVNDGGSAVMAAGWGIRHVNGQCYESALVWQVLPSQIVIDLGFLVGETVESRAEAVQPDGTRIVGGDATPETDSRAYIWTFNGTSWSVEELSVQVDASNTVYFRLATDINCNGLVCGWGIDGIDNQPLLDPLGFVLCPACTGNSNADYVVDVQDLVNVILNWDCTGACVGDVTHDLVVNVQDLSLVIISWGPCPGGSCPTNPPSFQAALANAGLTQSDWDLFSANVNDENHRCWMAYHLGGGGGAPSCPGPDPYN